MTARQHKVYENRVRRIAARQLLTLHRTRRRDPLAHDYGTYWLTDGDSKTIVHDQLSGIHAWLMTKH